MPRQFLSLLLLGVATVTVGMAVGYYAAMTDGLPISGDVLIIIALTMVAVLAAFHGGRIPTAVEVRPQSSTQPWDAFRRELDRSRRFERQFVLMRATPGGALQGPGEPGSDAGGPLGMLPLVLRGIDQAWAVDGDIYVLLPESDRASAVSLVARLRSTMPDAESLEDIQIAEFPQDGLTTGALIANLRPLPPPDTAPPMRLAPMQHDSERRRAERAG